MWPARSVHQHVLGFLDLESLCRAQAASSSLWDASPQLWHGIWDSATRSMMSDRSDRIVLLSDGADRTDRIHCHAEGSTSGAAAEVEVGDAITTTTDRHARYERARHRWTAGRPSLQRYLQHQAELLAADRRAVQLIRIDPAVAEIIRADEVILCPPTPQATCPSLPESLPLCHPPPTLALSSNDNARQCLTSTHRAPRSLRPLVYGRRS